MTDYRSDAEKFVTAFLDYVYEYDILDKLDKQTQKMVRSPGVQSLVTQAEKVFPARIKKGVPVPQPTGEAADEAIAAASNVIDTREMFSRKVQQNGGVREMLRGVLNGDVDARDRAFDFFKAEDGEKEFAKNVPPKV